MNKVLELVSGVAKALVPMAADLAKASLGAAGKLAGKAGGAAAKALRKKFKLQTRGVKRKTRKFLRTAALVSGLVCALSFAGLLLTHKK